MSDNSASWKVAAFGLMTAIVGGIVGVMYDDWKSPAPGLEVAGSVSTFAPYPPDDSTDASLVGPIYGYWTLTISNQGTKTASAVRLNFPPSAVVQFNGSYQRPTLGGNRIGYIDVGSMAPGEDHTVDGWIPVSVEPSINAFSVVHDLGYGRVRMISATQDIETTTTSKIIIGVFMTFCLGVIGLALWTIFIQWLDKRFRTRAA